MEKEREVLFEELYKASKKCVLNRRQYEDESGVIKIQLHNFGELMYAYNALKEYDSICTKPEQDCHARCGNKCINGMICND